MNNHHIFRSTAICFEYGASSPRHVCGASRWRFGDLWTGLHFQDGSMVYRITYATFFSWDEHTYIYQWFECQQWGTRVWYLWSVAIWMFVQSNTTQLLPRCTGSRTHPAATRGTIPGELRLEASQNPWLGRGSAHLWDQWPWTVGVFDIAIWTWDKMTDMTAVFCSKASTHQRGLSCSKLRHTGAVAHFHACRYSSTLGDQGFST